MEIATGVVEKLPTVVDLRSAFIPARSSARQQIQGVAVFVRFFSEICFLSRLFQ